ncbi:MAG: hypothetical protein Kow006_23410 [Gammaproteobacteria bacterium]
MQGRRVIRVGTAAFWLCCAAIAGVFAHAAPQPAIRSAFDVVTLKNGDLYNGAVARPHFDLRTPYGDISVPYGMMKSLRSGEEGDVLETQDGERYSGRLLNEEFQVLRVLDPTLPVRWAEVREIDFARRRTRLNTHLAPDQLWLQNGDRMLIRLAAQELLVRSGTGIQLVPLKEVATLELKSGEDSEYPRALIRRRGGAGVILGNLLTPGLRAELHYGGETEIAVSAVKAAVLKVNRGRQVGGYFPAIQPFRKSLANEIRDRLRSGGSGPVLVALPGGSYQRGDASGDGDERPPRELTVKPFAIGLFEVTFEEYDRFCRSTGRDLPEDAGWGRGHRPVVNVSWKEAKAYVAWLSEETGQRYRLPTDGEWEYAARAGSTARFWWGDDVGIARANCEGCGALWDGEMSAEVGRFPPNRFGLHDVAGNVWEWVEDCWSDSYADAPKDGSAYESAGCGKRVIRGGAWSFPPKEMRSANRWRDFPSRRSDDTGFRVVRELAKPQ